MLHEQRIHLVSSECNPNIPKLDINLINYNDRSQGPGVQLHTRISTTALLHQHQRSPDLPTLIQGVPTLKPPDASSIIQRRRGLRLAAARKSLRVAIIESSKRRGITKPSGNISGQETGIDLARRLSGS